MKQIRTLLCVEDDEDDCEWIREAAQKSYPDINFVHKANGKEALEYLNNQKQKGHFPCLTLLDLNMPVMNGRQTLIAIRADQDLKDLPVIVFSTSSSPADKAICKELGSELVTKPITLKELSTVIQGLLHLSCT
jgi:CheY-like chemotaxis protein